MLNQKTDKKLIIIENNKIKLYTNDILDKELDDVHIGKNGLSDNKVEGDLCTPKGIYKLGFAFGLEELDIEYPYYKINENVYWVSDSNSKYYNEWVEITDIQKQYEYSYMHSIPEIEWNEAEHLIDYPKEYELAIVIEYNINPQMPNKGSAIFFHLKNKETTSGCISTSKENMLYIIKWIGNNRAQILIK